MISAVAWQGFVDAWRAEWTKARTLTSTGWLLAASVALGVGLSAAVCTIVPYQSGTHQDPAKLALTGIQVAQAVVAIWAVRAICGEYRNSMIRTTLTAIPQRATLIAAKTAVITGLTLMASAVTVAGSLLVAHALLPGNGFTVAHDLPLSLDSASTLRAASGSILYLALISVLAIGVSLAARDSAGATGVVLGLLYIFPLAAQLAGNATWQRHLQQIGPTTAGLSIQATTNLDTLPISPWAGLTVLATWAAASFLLAGLSFCGRDS